MICFLPHKPNFLKPRCVLLCLTYKILSYDYQIQKSLTDHRELWRQETEREWKTERKRITDELKGEMKLLQEQLMDERETCDQLRTSVF